MAEIPDRDISALTPADILKIGVENMSITELRQFVDTTGIDLSVRRGVRLKAKDLIATNFANIPQNSTGVVLEVHPSHSIVNWYLPTGNGFIGKFTLNRSDYCKVEVMQ